MIIKILGTGCANCKALEQTARAAVEEMGLDATVEKVEDFKKIMQYGVMRTPGLVVNEKVKIQGRVPDKEEVKKAIREEL